MLTIHPNILERDGKKAFVILSYEEFILIEEELDEYEDLKELRAAKAKEVGEPTTLFKNAKRELGLNE
jgi:PHD/YefM family antitoxin component YafN of YafNO toxin-antitoxin module